MVLEGRDKKTDFNVYCCDVRYYGSLFPPLFGNPPEGRFGPDVDVTMIIYSEGWGPVGLGAALLYKVQMPDETDIWHGMILTFEHFDK